MKREIISEFGEANKIESNAGRSKTESWEAHEINGAYYLDIPQRVLNREILMFSRVMKTPYKLHHYGAGAYVHAHAHGENENVVVRFERKGDLIILRLVNHRSIADVSSTFFKSVLDNNYGSILYVFKIVETISKTGSIRISINDFFLSDNPIVGYRHSDLMGLDKSKSMIVEAKSSENHVQINQVLTYRASSKRTNVLSLELSISLVLLPQEPMIPRVYDENTGFFFLNKTDYSRGETQPLKKQYITRWRLEPSDWVAFLRGNKVDPVKPIVFYIDPATPKEWIPYIKEGVEEWEIAFEDIGFSNAIKARTVSKKDIEIHFDINGFDYSLIRFVANDNKGATSFSVHDPRSGEILKADIQLFQGLIKRHVIDSFVQTSAANSSITTLTFNTDLVGQLIKSIVAHEVGHALGLRHAFRASAAFPVDSLRSSTFTSRYGNSSSIMDYAWNNYIAQPEDSIQNFHPMVGPYDKWNIKYGYSSINNITKSDEELDILQNFIKEETDNNMVRFHGSGKSGNHDLGSDPVLASDYGIKNLKTVVGSLIEGKSLGNISSEDLAYIYERILFWYRTYLEHVSYVVGGYTFKNALSSNEGQTRRYYSPEQQKSAIRFLDDHLFKTPYWIVDSVLVNRMTKSKSYYSLEAIGNIQNIIINDLLSYNLRRIIQNEIQHGKEAFSLKDLYNEVKKSIFEDVKKGNAIDPYRRNLQKTTLEIFINKIISSEPKSSISIHEKSVVFATLGLIHQDIKIGVKKIKDTDSRHHLEYLLFRIEQTISNPKRNKIE